MYATPFSARVPRIAIAFAVTICLLSAPAIAQYRAQIGCPAEKIDSQSASITISDIQCACWGDTPKYRCQCRHQCGPSDPKPPPDPGLGRKFFFYEGRDIDGYDLRVLKGTNFANCTEQCKTEVRCRAFSYDKWNRWCFLKRNLPTELRAEPNSIVAVPESAKTRDASTPLVMLRYRNAIFVDPPYSQIRGINYVTCEQLCESDNICEAFTYIKVEKLCKLIRRPSEYFRNNPTADSGVKRQEPSS